MKRYGQSVLNENATCFFCGFFDILKKTEFWGKLEVAFCLPTIEDAVKEDATGSKKFFAEMQR
jgi:hypothetical protein